MSLILSILTLAVVGNLSFAAGASWIDNNHGQAHLEMVDGSFYKVKLYPDVKGVFFDREKHHINGDCYISVFEVLPSNPTKPTALCGAGDEVWLNVYKVASETLITRARVLVSSCLRSISMASQNSGEAAQNASTGFSIEWFGRVDAAGQAVGLTHYVLQDGVFTPQEVMNQ
jgi:hypothetical protein